MKEEADSVAKLVNNVLHPWLILAIVVAVIVYTNTTETLERVGWTLLPLAVAFIPVYVYTLIRFRRLRRTEDIDTGMRDTLRERPHELLISAFVFGIPPVLLLYFLSGPDEVLVLFIVTTAVMLFVALLNFVYRVSFHLALMTSSLCALWILTGVYSLITLPLIFLAVFFRRRLGAHTSWQLLTGAVLGAVVALLIFNGFGFV
jgi:hypothetical protein